jgi:hypothetical protein
MSAAKSLQTTSIFQVVADMQERMEDHGLSPEVVDAIVRRGLEILIGLADEPVEL